MRGAAFLDRDGVINNHGGYINRPQDFALLPGAGSAIRRLNDAAVPVVVVTNQGGVALGYLTPDDLDAIHAKMELELAKEGARIDAIYACVHHPDTTIPEYRANPRCRKPEPGMLESARDDLGIDLSASFMVGDTTTDILAGQRAGCRTILVRTGYAGKDGIVDVTPDWTVADLSEAVDRILKELANGAP